MTGSRPGDLERAIVTPDSDHRVVASAALPPGLVAELAAAAVTMVSPDGLAERAERYAAALIEVTEGLARADAHLLPELLVPIAACAFALAPPDEPGTQDAVTTGFAVGTRLAAAIDTATPGAWWAAGATAATIAAAVAGARVVGLDGDRAVAALAFATTQAPALDVRGDSGPRRWRAARAASSAVDAVLTARAGLVGPAAALTGTHGLFGVLGVDASASDLSEGEG